MKHGELNYFLAALTVSIITGCGGGGGGSDDENTSDESALLPVQNETVVVETPSLYNGVTTAILINQENAETITRVFLSGSNNASIQSAQSANTEPSQSLKRQMGGTTTYNQANTLTTLNDTDEASDTDEPLIEVIEGEVSGTNTVEDYRGGSKIGKLIFNFSNFDNGSGETLYGKVTYEAASYNQQFDLVTDLTITYYELRKTQLFQDNTITGTLKYYYNDQTGSQTFTANYDTQNNNSVETLRFENLATEINVVGKIDEETYVFSESTSGRIFLSSFGYFDITTQSPLLCVQCDKAEYLEGGTVQLKGKNNSDMILTVLNSDQVQAIIDEDGDDNYESTLIFNFANLGL